MSFEDVIEQSGFSWRGEDGHKHRWKVDESYTRVCEVCGQIYKDMDTYLHQLCNPLPISSVVDVGTGLKGVVGSHFWRKKKRIKQGWACDIWKIKPSPYWKPLNMDALKLGDVFPRDGVDVVQAFGFLEHLKEEDAYKFLEIAERIAKKLVILSAATTVHGPTRDYKVKRDGNPYHYYWSTWQWRDFQEMGWQTNLEDARNGVTMTMDCIAWKKQKL